MSKAERVIEYYVLCNKLKDIVRTGWKDWGVKRERVESIAEHIYGVQMLALGMYSEYKYDVDIYKVILMIAIHELGETIIGDLTQFDIEKEEKKKIEHFYGKYVYSLSCIVGKNGTGKTSIVDFLRETFFRLVKLIQMNRIECEQGYVAEESYKKFNIFDK